MDTRLQDFASDPLTRRLDGVTQFGKDIGGPYMSEIIPGLWQGGAGFGLILPGFIEHLVSLARSGFYDVRHQLASRLAFPMDDSEHQPLDKVDRIALWPLGSRTADPRSSTVPPASTAAA